MLTDCFEEDCWFWDPSSPPTSSRDEFARWAKVIDTAFSLDQRRLHISFLLSEGNKTAYRVTLFVMDTLLILRQIGAMPG